jgi:putative ABC transport system permease protein
VTTLWSKAAADVWRARSRTVLVVMAIAIGLSGFLAVLSTYSILQRELDRGYLATNPASAIVRTEAVDEALLARVIARDDIDDADARRVLSASLRTGDGAWRRAVLFVLRDFTSLRINTVTPEGGEWPPAAGGMLIERDAFQVAKARIGDVVTMRTSDGSEHQIRVAGGVHDPGQAQARMENMVYGYITPETLARLGETPTLDRLQVVVSGNRFDEAHIRRVATDLKGWLEQQGHRVRRVDVPEPGQHPHTVIMGFLLLVMAAFGFFALVLSGVIVVNLLFATMANERRQVGVMKAIGGTRRQIAAIYLGEAALFGAAAIALAAPIGIWGGRALSRYFAVLLNFDLASLAVPAWVYLLVAIVGLIVPIAAAAYPVAVGTRITVRDAIAAEGVDPSAFGGRRADRMLAAIALGRGPLLLGVRNSLRRRTRLALTLLTLTLAGAFFMAALSFRTSMIATFDRLFGQGTFGADDRYAFDQHMLMIYVFLIVVSGVLAAVGGLGLTTTMSLNILDRRRELGVMRAIGATPAMVSGIVILEALFVVVLAWGLGLIVAWLLTTALGTLMSSLMALTKMQGGLVVSLAPAAVLGWLGVAAALAVLSSVVPALTASRRSIREAISYE